MKRQITALALLAFLFVLLLVACSADPCSYGDNLPSCQTNRSVANATIVAVNSDADARVRQGQMRATQDSIALRAQATQGAINSQATQSAVEIRATQGARDVEAQATRQAVEIGALRQQVVMSATQSAISLGALQQQVVAQATQTSLEGDAKVHAAEVQAATAQTGQIMWFAAGMVLVISAVVMFVWYGRRVGKAMVHGTEVRASLVYYGPNQDHLALVAPGPNGDKHVFVLDELIGPHALLSGGGTLLDGLDLGDKIKLFAAIEQAKRSKATFIAGATGQFPELSDGDTQGQPALQSPTEDAIDGEYRITTVEASGETGRWLREVNERLALAAPAAA